MLISRPDATFAGHWLLVALVLLFLAVDGAHGDPLPDSREPGAGQVEQQLEAVGQRLAELLEDLAGGPSSAELASLPRRPEIAELLREFRAVRDQVSHLVYRTEAALVAGSRPPAIAEVSARLEALAEAVRQAAVSTQVSPPRTTGKAPPPPARPGRQAAESAAAESRSTGTMRAGVETDIPRRVGVEVAPGSLDAGRPGRLVERFQTLFRATTKRAATTACESLAEDPRVEQAVRLGWERLLVLAPRLQRALSPTARPQSDPAAMPMARELLTEFRHRLRRAREAGLFPHCAGSPRLGPENPPATAAWRSKRGAAPANDACASATPIGNGSFSGDTSSATNDGSASCGSSGSSPDVWFHYTAPAAGRILASTIGSSYETVLSAHTGCPGTSGNEIACGAAFGAQPVLDLNVTAGQEIRFRVSGTSGSSGAFQLSVGAPGGISGTVTASDTGSPLPVYDISVDIYDSTGRYISYGYAYPDAMGEYSLGDLPAGSYRARTFNWVGYLDELFDDLPCEPDCDESLGTPVDVAAGATTAGVDFVLDPGGKIAGVITDAATGSPLSYTCVDIYDAGGAWLTNSCAKFNGEYEVGGLATGDYFAVTDNRTGHFDELYDDILCAPSCTVTSGMAISVTAPATTAGIDFALDKGGTVAGRVTDAVVGASIRWARVTIFDGAGAEVADAFSDENGWYESRKGLPTGSYHATTRNFNGWVDELWDDLPCPDATCDPTTGDPIAVTSGLKTDNIDFGLTKAGGAIAGQVTDAATGQPLENIDVDIYDSVGNPATSYGYSYSDAAGLYVSDETLPAGTYYARTMNFRDYLDELYDDLDCSAGCNPTAGTPIIVSSYALGVDFALEKDAAIAGRVTEAGSGDPIAGAQVRIYDSVGGLADSATTDADGYYISDGGLTPGSYYAATFGVGTHFDELYSEQPCDWSGSPGCDPTAGTAIPVVAGATTAGVNFTLDRTGAISGTVTESGTAAPLEGIRISIYDATGGFVTNAFTEADGTYTGFGLTTGDYFARTVSERHLDELYDDLPCLFLGCDETAGTPIAVVTGATTAGIDFVLDLGGSISGQVVEEGTLGPLDVTLEAFDSTGARAGFSFTEADGTFTLGSLPTGSYFLLVDSDTHVNEVYDDTVCFPCDESIGMPITVTQGLDTPGIDFALALGGSIGGFVTEFGSGAPKYFAEVAAYNAGGEYLTSGYSLPDGSYAVGGLPSGLYFLWVDSFVSGLLFGDWWVPELYRDSSCGWVECSLLGFQNGTAVPVVLPEATAGVDIEVEPGGFIKGMVTEAGSGAPVEGIRVDYFDETGLWQTYGRSDATGAHAPFYYPLAAGNYYAATTNGVTPYIDELYPDIPCPRGAFAINFGIGCDPTLGDAVTVVDGADTLGVDFELAVGGGVTGIVSESPGGAPIGDLFVRAADAAGEEQGSNETEDDGTYSILGLPDGTYYVYTDSSTHLDEVYDDQPCSLCDPTAGTPIAVAGAATVPGIDFDLAIGGGISGRITREETGGAVSATVEVFDASGEMVESSRSESDGSYAIHGLPSGSYFAATRTSALFNELYSDIPCPGGAGPLCDPITGTAIPVVDSFSRATTTGVDFALRTKRCAPNLVLDGPPIATPGVVFEGCQSITAGGGFDVLATGGVVLRAGESVELTEGFSAVGSLEIDIDPSIYEP